MATERSGAGAFKRYHPDFDVILGDSPSFSLILEISPANKADDPAKTPQLFHEAGVWVRHTHPAQRDEIYITSNILGNGDSTKRIEIASLELPTSTVHTTSTILNVTYKQKHYTIKSPAGHQVTQLGTPAAIPMGNGGTAWGNRILFCNQGQDKAISEILLKQAETGTVRNFPGGLVAYDPADRQWETIVDSFHGRPFNSPNDVILHKPTGWIFFTDPIYGSEQGFKDKPQLPNAAWAYHHQTQQFRMVADGFDRPNGIVFSPDFATCYITDTGYIHGDGSLDGNRPATIYAYDVLVQKNNVPSLQNRRVFAFVDCGAPDGIKCDLQGNVYTGCFDGVHIFAPQGVLLGKILLDGGHRGCANLVFGPDKQLFILSETAVFVARLGIQGALGPVEVAKSQSRL